MSIATRALLMMSFKAGCAQDFHNNSTHEYLSCRTGPCIKCRCVENRLPCMAIQMVSSGIRSPMAEIGGAFNRAPDSTLWITSTECAKGKILGAYFSTAESILSRQTLLNIRIITSIYIICTQ